MVGVEVTVLAGEAELDLAVGGRSGLFFRQPVQFMDEDVLDATEAGGGEVDGAPAGRLQTLLRVIPLIDGTLIE